MPIKYQENSNVFAYYIVVSILLNSHNLFFQWCKTNNNKIYQSNLDNQNYQILFCDYIIQNCDCNKLKTNLRNAKKNIMNTHPKEFISLRMLSM